MRRTTKRNLLRMLLLATTVTALLAGASPAWAASVKFAPASNSAVEHRPVDATSGDFDGDGKLDLATANYSGEGGVSVLLNDGSGSFETPRVFAAGSGSSGVTSADFDDDGKLDLAVANAASDSVSVLLGEGSGGFGRAHDFPMGAGAQPFAIASDDFDGDGRTDLAVANLGSDSASIMINATADPGFVSFAPALGSNLAVGDLPVDLTSGDFDGNGNPDLAVRDSGPKVSVFINDGFGRFGSSKDFTVGDGQGLTSADLNGDSKLDLAVTETFSDTVSVLPGDGSGGFGPRTVSFVGSSAVEDGPQDVVGADFDGDGKMDLATANNFSGVISVLPGDDSGNFWSSSADFAVGAGPVDLVTINYNDDNKPDLAAANDGSRQISVLRNTTGENAPPVANNDSYRISEDRLLRVPAPGVLRNDKDPDGDALAASLVYGPSKGRLSLNPDGSFVYRPKRNFHGTDSFTYALNDGAPYSLIVKATIKVRSRPK